MQVGGKSAHPRPSAETGAASPLLWKFEYPVVRSLGGGDLMDVMTLTIWCSTGSSGKPASAERVAQVLAPAIAERISQETPTIEFEVRSRTRRSSGSQLAISEPITSGRASREVDVVAS
jgi:hypothetical protein